MTTKPADDESDRIDHARIRQAHLSHLTNPRLTKNICKACFNTALVQATMSSDGIAYTFAFVCPFCHSNDLWNYRHVAKWDAEKHEREGFARLRA